MKFGSFLAILVISGGVSAQGISNARDRNGNLVERGAATRTYPTVPMANSAVVRTTPQGDIVVERPRMVIIQETPRR
jgi:hypothetical protein